MTRSMSHSMAPANQRLPCQSSHYKHACVVLVRANQVTMSMCRPCVDCPPWLCSPAVHLIHWHSVCFLHPPFTALSARTSLIFGILLGFLQDLQSENHHACATGYLLCLPRQPSSTGDMPGGQGPEAHRHTLLPGLKWAWTE